MYLHIYSFRLHLWKIGWLYHVRFIYFLRLSTDDLSVGKIAIQSHTYLFPGSRYSANNAVDRNTNTCTRTRAIGYGPQFHVVFWVVDLERVHNIYSIDIFFLKMVTVCTRITPKNPETYSSWPNCFSLTKIQNIRCYTLPLISLSWLFWYILSEFVFK